MLDSHYQANNINCDGMLQSRNCLNCSLLSISMHCEYCADSENLYCCVDCVDCY